MSAQAFGGKPAAPGSAAAEGEKAAALVAEYLNQHGVAEVSVVKGTGYREYKLYSNGTGELISGIKIFILPYRA